MSRPVIIVAIGSAGDVHPFAVIAAALKRRGHRVTLMANGHFAALARQLGLNFVPIGSEEEYQQAMRDPTAWHPRKGFATVWRYLAPSIERTYDRIAERAEPDTVLVGSTLALGARIARDALGLPLVSGHLAPMVMLSALDPPRVGPFLFPGNWPPWLVRALLRLGDRVEIDPLAAPVVNRVRARAGLGPVRHIMSEYCHSPDALLFLFPEWFGADPGDWPPHGVHAGFPLFDEGGLHGLQPALLDFLSAGGKPLLFTPGSAMQHAHRFFRNAVDTCRALGRRGIVVTRYTAQLPKLPPDILRLDYVPFSQVLPEVDLVAYHGGIGTCAQALAAGVPQLVVPNAHDQFDNARRVERLGVGRRLDRDAPARAFLHAVDTLLRDDALRARCKALTEAVTPPEQVIATACRVIELAR